MNAHFSVCISIILTLLDLSPLFSSLTLVNQQVLFSLTQYLCMWDERNISRLQAL